MDKKWNIGWGIETRCTMNCEFCYSREVRPSVTNMNLEIYKNFMDKNWKFIDSINYGTGENSLSEDWFKLIEYIGLNYPMIRQGITTNGHIAKACEDQEKEKIFKRFIDEVDVSLDFACAERHNQFRGNKEAFDLVMSTLQLCRKCNKCSTIVFLGTDEVVTPQNLKGLFDIANSFNAYLRTNIYRPTQGINVNTSKFILSYSSLLNMLQWIYNNHRIIRISDQLLSPVLFNEISEDYSGYSSLRILGDGSITPSTYLIGEQYRKFNISNDVDISNIDFSEQIARDKIPSACRDCTLVRVCKGGTYDRRLLWYGTLDERDPYCPKRYPDSKLNDIKLVKDDKFSSIHDKYLPTMFFAY